MLRGRQKHFRQKGEALDGLCASLPQPWTKGGKDEVGVSERLGAEKPRTLDNYSLEHGTYCWIVQRGCDTDTKQVLYR
jgi:hypothetical protein